MASSGCLVGIDGLPLGTHAVAVVDGDIVASFDVVDGAGQAVDLEGRVGEAVRRAHELAGVEVREVRLLCIDDGGTGQRLDRLGERLAADGILFRVYDLLAERRGPDIDLVGTLDDRDSARSGLMSGPDGTGDSRARARRVALRPRP